MTRALDTKGKTLEESQDLYNLSDEEQEIKQFHKEWERQKAKLPSVGHQDKKTGRYLTKKETRRPE